MRRHANHCSEFHVGRWLEICLQIVSPAILATILAKNLYNTLLHGYGDYPIADQLLLGWGLVAAMLLFALLIDFASKRSPHRELWQSQPISSTKGEKKHE